MKKGKKKERSKKFIYLFHYIKKIIYVSINLYFIKKYFYDVYLHRITKNYY